jgi:cytochrome d ubiquinol oxidase subunit II
MAFVPLWFVLIAVLWTGFFVLEGFDMGVGMLHAVIGKDEPGKQTVLATIGPLWDGNEVWLVVAAAAMFAAFPGWYATMFSGFYLIVVLMLLALILRGTSFEYRGKNPSRRWHGNWSRLLIVASLLACPSAPTTSTPGTSATCSRRTRSSWASRWWRYACCTAPSSSR